MAVGHVTSGQSVVVGLVGQVTFGHVLQTGHGFNGHVGQSGQSGQLGHVSSGYVVVVGSGGKAWVSALHVAQEHGGTVKMKISMHFRLQVA